MVEVVIVKGFEIKYIDNEWNESVTFMGNPISEGIDVVPGCEMEIASAVFYQAHPGMRITAIRAMPFSEFEKRVKSAR